MKVLLACEFSGTVRDEFIKLGHDPISCDLEPSVTPGPHYRGDVMDIINDDYDLIIAFPPCTHLAVSGAKHFAQKIADGRQQQGIDFFMAMVNAPCKRIVIENPIGIMSRVYRKPDQIIQPWQFGDPFQKTTCLWLKNMPLLKHTKIVDKGDFYISPKTGKKLPSWYGDATGEDGKKLAYGSDSMKKVRNKTFPGIANAFATQYTDYILNHKELTLF